MEYDDNTQSAEIPSDGEVLKDSLVEDGQTVTSIPHARAVTRARAKDLRAILSKYIHRHLPYIDSEVEEQPSPPRLVGTHARLLPYLKWVPWLLAVLFGFSFLWDFPNLTVRLFSIILPLDGLLRIVSVSGLIGFFTNWLAITMLFNPRAHRPIFGQGLIPAQRERVIYRLAKAISDELINETIIKQKIETSGVIPKYREIALSVTRGVLEDPEFRNDLKGLTTDYVNTVLASEQVRKRLAEFTIEKLESYLGEGIGGLALKAYRFLSEEDFQRRIDQAIRTIPMTLDSALDELDDLLDTVPEKIEARSEEIEEWVTRVVLGFVENLNIYDMIISNMKQYDEKKLEILIKNTSNEQLNYIKYLGGVLGFFGGMIIWQPLLSLTTFGVLGLVLFVIDEAIFRSWARKG